MAQGRAVISTIAALGAAAISVAAVGCGSSSNELSAEQVSSIKREAVRELKAEQRERAADRKLDQLERDLKRLKRERRKEPRAAAPSGGGSAPAPASSPSSCGNNISVNSVTTCPFAANVAAAYYDSGPGTVYATSPVTGRTYAMSCSAGVTTVCTGGDGAAVYIR